MTDTQALERFAGAAVVIKIGGELIDDDEARARLARDLAQLLQSKVRVAIVHGGKPQIDRALAVAGGSQAERVDGLRITDEATVAVMWEVYREVAGKLADELHRCGVAAHALAGHEGLLRARPIDSSRPELRLVGKVESVATEQLDAAWEQQAIPLVSPLGWQEEDSDQPLNINADHAAVAMAKSLRSAALLLLTDVTGVRGRDGEQLPTLKREEYQMLKEEGVIADGMIPKVESALEALAGGVDLCRIANGMAAAPVVAGLVDATAGTSVVA